MANTIEQISAFNQGVCKLFFKYNDDLGLFV